MRKIMMMVVALVAMTFVNCGQKSVNNVEASDSSTVVTTEEAGEIAKAAIEELKSNIDAKDANAVQEAITSIQEKVKEYIQTNPEAAKAYVTEVQSYLKENAEAIKTIVGNNAMVNTAVTTLTAASADEVVSSLSAALTTTEVAGEEAATSVKENAEQALESVKENAKAKANEMVDNAKAKAEEKKNEAKQKANEKVNEAAQNTNKAINSAAEKAAKKLGL